VRGPRAQLAVALAALIATALAAASPGHAASRDDTAWLQAKLDAGGNVVLPRLPNGECYRTRGLWVSHDDTSISSDGACLVATGRGEARIKDAAGIPIHANAVFYVNHSDIYKPLPVRISISGVRIVVPPKKALHGVELDGVSVGGHEVTLDHVTIGGAPKFDVEVGGGKPGSAGMTERIAIRDCAFSGGTRDVLSAFGAVDLLVERTTLADARAQRGYSNAGLHIGSADRGQPALAIRAKDNRIVGNAGPGILVDLDPANGAPVVASSLELSGNQVLGNARSAPAVRRAGIVLVGGQDDATGDLLLANNVVHGNRGPGVLGRNLRLVVHSSGNDLSGNRGGDARGLSNVGPVGPASPGNDAPAAAPAFAGGARDDTAWLQSRLDQGGGTVFLPRLPNGECYRTHGLWVSRDDTTITSDGACIVSLGPGPVRLHSIDGDPIASNGVFFVNRSDPKQPAPVRVSISNLRIVVPAGGDEMYGIAVFGHHVTLSGLDISGSPKDDVLIGARANGNGYVTRVSVLDCTLSGAMRNAISAFGVMDLQIERNTIRDVRDSPPGQPAAGIDVEPDERSQPTLGLRIADNTIVDNAGPGILLSLESNSGPAVIATDMAIVGNRVERNSRRKTPPTLAGVAITGGQDDGAGTLALKNNIIKDNGGPGILMRALKLIVDASGNDLGGNRPGP
jgi:hypothetical protein